MRLFLSVSAVVAGFFIASPVLAEGKYFTFAKELEKREAALTIGKGEEAMKNLMDLIHKKNNFLKECKDSNEEKCKTLLHDILSQELEMMKMGRRTEKDMRKELRKAIKDLKKM